MTNRFHLDPVGGISGDMFIGAIVDCQPKLADGLHAVLCAVGLDEKVHIEHKPHNDGVLAGSRFLVKEVARDKSHHHTAFHDISNLLHESNLNTGVKSRAMDIFERLARAEAKVHGVSIDDVTFHEVGAVDSIADITLSAHLIEALGAASWSLSQVPMGSGKVQSQHGPLPLPAPATLLLLEGLPVIDDGIGGERVTPTGAAILNHLEPGVGGPSTLMRLERSGMGFGSTSFGTLSNVLRVMEFAALIDATIDQITVLAFEVDDQTPEDLAIGLENLREAPGVLDVTVSAVTAKKGRQANSIQILCTPESETATIDACFMQTTTLGVRYHRTRRSTLTRSHVNVGNLGVKVATRPDGNTAKAEMDDLAKHYPTRKLRASAAHSAATAALKDVDPEPSE